MYDDREIKEEWLQMFDDYKDFFNRHFKNDGYNIYVEFKESLRGYHYTELELDNVPFVDERGEMIRYDIFSCRIVGGDEKAYIRINYDMSCSNEEIFDCFLVEPTEITKTVYRRVE